MPHKSGVAVWPNTTARYDAGKSGHKKHEHVQHQLFDGKPVQVVVELRHDEEASVYVKPIGMDMLPGVMST